MKHIWSNGWCHCWNHDERRRHRQTMRITRFGRRIAAWLLLVAIGVNALAPLASLVGHARAAAGVEICTAAGIRFVPESPQAPSAPASPAERALCTLCIHCAPSGGHAPLAVGTPRVALPRPDRASPRPHHAATPILTHSIPGARPRAPPALLVVV